MKNPLGELSPLPIMSKMHPDEYRALDDNRLLKDENCSIGTIYAQCGDDFQVIATFVLTSKKDGKETWEEFK